MKDVTIRCARACLPSLLLGATCALSVVGSPALGADVSLECSEAKREFEIMFPIVGAQMGIEIQDRTDGEVIYAAGGVLAFILKEQTDINLVERCVYEIMSAEGFPVHPRDPDSTLSAVETLRKVADQGLAEAQNDLGIAYESGSGVPNDIVQAHMWYDLAARQGDENATKNRESLAGKMTLEQIAEAKKLADEWRAKSSSTALTPTIQRSPSAGAPETSPGTRPKR